MSADFPSPKFAPHSQDDLFWESALNETFPDDYTPGKRSARSRSSRVQRSKLASPAASSAASSAGLVGKDGKPLNQNAVNAKLNRERIKAERSKMEAELKTLRDQLADSRRSQASLSQQLEVAKEEIRQLQTTLQASPHVGKLLEHLSGITMSFDSHIDAGQKRSAEDTADASSTKRTRNTQASTSLMTVPIQFNIQIPLRQ